MLTLRQNYPNLRSLPDFTNQEFKRSALDVRNVRLSLEKDVQIGKEVIIERIKEFVRYV